MTVYAIYEITNGYLGFAMTRVYVCAKTDERALELAQIAFRVDAEKHRYPAAYWQNLTITAKKPCNGEWVSVPSDEGLVLAAGISGEEGGE